MRMIKRLLSYQGMFGHVISMVRPQPQPMLTAVYLLGATIMYIYMIYMYILMMIIINGPKCRGKLKEVWSLVWQIERCGHPDGKADHLLFARSRYGSMLISLCTSDVPRA
jgi:hypothetical protein